MSEAGSKPDGEGGDPESAGKPVARWMGLVRSRLARGGLVSKVMTLAGGTALAQLIGVAASPILTRLYTPADYGVLAALNSLVGFLVIPATMRYQLAITVAAEDRQARALLGVSLVSAVVATAAAVVVAVIPKGTSSDREVVVNRP